MDCLEQNKINKPGSTSYLTFMLSLGQNDEDSLWPKDSRREHFPYQYPWRAAHPTIKIMVFHKQ